MFRRATVAAASAMLASACLQRTAPAMSCGGSPSCNVAAFCRPQLLAE